MIEKEISELRRRFRPDKTNITKIRGCYVNESGDIIAEFYESLGMMPVEQSEEILSLLKKTLSGGIGKNLLDIEFTTNEVLELPEHKLLQDLKKSALGEDASVRELCEKIRSSLKMETAYLILLASDRYDVPSFSKSGDEEEESNEIFSYFVCAICPVKLTKNLLGFHAHENKFCNIHPDYAIAPPSLGFLFPTFDDRTANIYKTMFYTRSASDDYETFFETVFGKQTTLMPAAVQKETFETILAETVGEECNMNVVKSVQSELLTKIAEHKEAKKAEPLVIEREVLTGALADSGVSAENIKAFEERFDAEFGEEVALPPANLVAKDLRVEMSDVSIKINSDRADLIRTRVIDGVKYLLIRADEDVEVNGVKIHIG
ncbi:MAG: DUF4317 domain-containing protein [Clostridia bacterium]|nr:DUF4317 domain-containing protein [Clostridia bacterium]